LLDLLEENARRELLLREGVEGAEESRKALNSRDRDLLADFFDRPAAAVEERRGELTSSESGLVDTGWSPSTAADALAVVRPADRGEVSSEEDISLHWTVLSSFAG
jgi:hypothetical protein